MRHTVILLSLVALAPCTSACGEASAQSAQHAGTWDDLPVADDDLLGLERLLSNKLTYFLYQMDRYNEARDSGGNDAMIAAMGRVFASSFTFHAYYADGSEFGTVQGDYSPETWIGANDVSMTFGVFHGGTTLVVPSYEHMLTVDDAGRRVTLRGYHEHLFIGADLRLIIGDARHVADETAVFEKVGGVWRITEYSERVFRASEMTAPSGPPMP